MDIRDRARTLALASTLALTIASLAVAQAHAVPNDTPQGRCESQAGGVWDAKKKACATKYCMHNGQAYTHGDTRSEPGTGPGHIKLRKTFECDGFTGKWIARLSPGTDLPEEPGALSQ